jgi:hypothetical protein
MDATAEAVADACAKRCAASASDLALLYAGQPDAKVASSLAEVRANLEAKLAKVRFGADVDVGALVERFVASILDQKAAIERGGASDGRSS